MEDLGNCSDQGLDFWIGAVRSFEIKKSKKKKDCYNEANTSLKKCLRDWNGPDGAELVDGQCFCNDDLVLTPSGDLCYDGIDSFFDDTKYKCDNNDLETLLQDINYHWGLDHPERLSVNCSVFGYPVIQVDLIGEFEQDLEDSGISPALQPIVQNDCLIIKYHSANIFLYRKFISVVNFVLNFSFAVSDKCQWSPCPSGVQIEAS